MQVVGWLLVVAGVLVAAAMHSGMQPPFRTVEAALAAVALGTIIAVPGILALLSRYGRPALRLPAAIVLVPLSMLSFAGVLLPLLIPAIYLVVSFAHSDAGSAARTFITTSAVVFLLIGAVAALLVHQDPRSYHSETSGYGTSDIITYAEAALSLALSGGSVLAGWRLASRASTPERRRGGIWQKIG